MKSSSYELQKSLNYEVVIGMLNTEIDIQYYYASISLNNLLERT